MIKKPGYDQYRPYFATYIDLVPDNADVLQLLKDNQQKTFDLFSSLTNEQAMYTYAEGKWTLKEVLGHMIDTERVFSYRAFVFSREDISLPGFDQDTYINSTDYNSRDIFDLAGEYKALRDATLYLYRSFSHEQLTRSGVASGNLVNVAALVYMTAGHELYHLKLVEERYQQ
ncbi:DinB family protein [Mucilaginibacter sp. 44-25]|uniref:DinB family protein n=1 Tax=Mucilaginibacter sp. 44-25 TaxID=1895794 RepID=UPI00095A74ED|nr:DinB family protein [Mucilaginibacter sp. 44-25]OJW12608.1 MAG: hypothetical protein BGO48_05865 [Mucilaginibacter sp. 44-25]